jgi:hypothetical protein
VGHGLDAARRAAFVRTAFASTAPYSDDPRKLLGWANVALVERAGPSSDFVTVACVTHLPGERLLRWAYAGHPPALWLRDGRELTAPRQGVPLGLFDEPRYAQGSLRSEHPAASILLYTDGLTEARRNGDFFGLERVSAVLAELEDPTPSEAVALLRTRVAEFAASPLTDDLCLLAARNRLAENEALGQATAPAATGRKRSGLDLTEPAGESRSPLASEARWELGGMDQRTAAIALDAIVRPGPGRLSQLVVKAAVAAVNTAMRHRG